MERKRYQKIAKAMGTRTTQQVASHVQKYFIKLANAGLPVPGRMPNMARYTRSKKVCVGWFVVESVLIERK